MGYNNGYDEGVPPAADIVQLLRHAPVVFTIRNFRGGSLVRREESLTALAEWPKGR